MTDPDILIVSTEERFTKRCVNLSYSLEYLKHFDDVDLDRNYTHKFIIIDGRLESGRNLAGAAQVMTQVAPNSKLILVVANKVPVEEIKFIYQSGVHLILFEDEFLTNQKLDFFISHYIKNQYIPVKSYDFDANTNPDFKVFHLISFKGTFIQAFFGEISPEKLKKAQAVNELYVKREDIGNFGLYLKSLPNSSGEKLLSRCRAKYLEFYEEYIKMLFTLTDNSKYYTFDEGKALLCKIQKMASELLAILSSASDPWLVVNNLASDKSLSTLSRTPSVAAYAGITALELEIPNPEEIMLACLMSDIGLLDLPYLAKVPYAGEARNIYLNHPTRSINLVLERRVPLPETIKQIVLHTHENLSGTGFPRGDFNFDRFPIESQIIQICQMLDEKALIQWGTLRPKIDEVKGELMKILSDTYLFDASLVLKIQNLWQPKKVA